MSHSIVSHSHEKPIEIFIFSLQCDDEKRHSLHQTLSEDEKHRAIAYRFDKHRHRFITGRATIREILADKGACQAREISFALNSYGKPSALAPESVRYLQFSASSSGAMGAARMYQGSGGRTCSVRLALREELRSDVEWTWRRATHGQGRSMRGSTTHYSRSNEHESTCSTF